jgi:membrane protease YdiL (CAAX protease family)
VVEPRAAPLGHAAQPPDAPAPPADAAPAGPLAWRPWTAPAALIAGIVLAGVGALLVDIPAALAGVKITTSHTPPGIVLADTFVQDAAFVLVVMFFAQLGRRSIAAWQFGLRPTRVRAAVGLVVLTVGGFLLFAGAWSLVVHVPKEKLLRDLGAERSAALLTLSAVLTCVVAPACEEILFRGYIFAALRNWRGVWPAALITGAVFGGVHAGSAPAADLFPLFVLGVALCLLYQRTRSLYPCIAAHAVNNSIAFGSLAGWRWWQVPLLMAGSLAVLTALALALRSAGVIGAEPATVGAGG